MRLGSDLEPSCSCLGPSWRHLVVNLWPSWGHLGASLGLLGRSWGFLGASRSRLDAILDVLRSISPKSQKMQPLQRGMLILGVKMEPRWGQVGPSWAQVGPKLRSGGILEATWSNLPSYVKLRRPKYEKHRKTHRKMRPGVNRGSRGRRNGVGPPRPKTQ